MIASLCLRLGRRVFCVQSAPPWIGVARMRGKAWGFHLGLVASPDQVEKAAIKIGIVDNASERARDVERELRDLSGHTMPGYRSPERQRELDDLWDAQ